MKTPHTLENNEYNGWPNYQTWNVMLWMDNYEGSYRLYRDTVQRCKVRNLRFTGMRARQCCEQAFGDKTGDGVRFSNGRIKWGAIAKAMREE